jgi:phage terminase small subunit
MSRYISVFALWISGSSFRKKVALQPKVAVFRRTYMTESENKEFPNPPDHLLERSKQLWVELVGSRIKGTSRIVTFQTALEYLDLADTARQERLENGMVVKTKRTGVPHLNPVLRVEQQAMASFLKIWQQLGLNREKEPKNPFGGMPGVMEM